MDLDLERYHRDGYAILRGLLSADEVSGVAAAFEDLLGLARGLDGTADVGSARFVVQAEPFRLHRVVWCGGVSDRLAALGADPRFVNTAAHVLQAARVVQLIQQAHFKLPGDEVDFAWHQDASNRRYGSELWTDVDGRGSFVQMLLAVDAAGAENGGLSVIPGSHRQGFVADAQTGALPPECIDVGAAVTPELAPGDVLLFGPFLIHGSRPNRGDRPRRTLIQGYALPGANRRVYPGCGQGVARHT